eukprot:2293859-Rhodomonas_salina.1
MDSSHASGIPVPSLPPLRIIHERYHHPLKCNTCASSSLPSQAALVGDPCKASSPTLDTRCHKADFLHACLVSLVPPPAP